MNIIKNKVKQFIQNITNYLCCYKTKSQFIYRDDLMTYPFYISDNNSDNNSYNNSYNNSDNSSDNNSDNNSYNIFNNERNSNFL